MRKQRVILECGASGSAVRIQVGARLCFFGAVQAGQVAPVEEGIQPAHKVSWMRFREGVEVQQMRIFGCAWGGMQVS